MDSDPDDREILNVEPGEDGRVERQCDAYLHCTRLIHDLATRTERHIDATDRTVTYRYDRRGNLESVIDGLDNETRYEHDDRDQLTRLTDAEGGVSEWIYDEDGDLVRQIRPYPEGADPADYTTIFDHNDFGQVTSVTQPDGTFWRLIYDADGNLEEIRDGADRVVETHTYDARGVLIGHSDVFGTSAYNQVNDFGEPLEAIDPDGSVSTMTYNALGKIETMSSAAGNWTFQYDSEGRERLANFGDFVQETEYDVYGRVSADINPLLGRIERHYDAAGRLESWSSEDGTAVAFARDAAGRLISRTEADGRSVSYEHDAAGRVWRVVDPASGEQTFERDGAGRVKVQRDALAHETRFSYNPDGTLAQLEDAARNLWRFSYGPGWTEATDPLQRTERTETGPEGEPTRIVHHDGTEMRFEYLPVAPNGERQAFPARVIDEGDRAREYGYGSLGHLASATDLAGEAWTYDHPTTTSETITAPDGTFVREDAYDVDGRLSSQRFADDSVLRFAYDLRPEPSQMTLPSGIVVDLSYNRSGLLTSRSSSSGESETVVWDAVGNLASHTDSTGTTTYTYDSGGRLAAITRSDGLAVSYGHDVLARVTSVTVTDGEESHATTSLYRYDAVGNLIEVEMPDIGVTTYTYDAAHRLQERTLPNGIVSSWAFNDRDQVTEVAHRDALGTVLASFVYERAPGGEIEAVEREDGSRVEYGYDTALRLASERRLAPDGTLLTELAYTYDKAGNRLTRTVDSETATSSYLTGFRLDKVEVGGVAVEAYSWNSDGAVAGLARGGESWTFGYDTKQALRSASDGTTTWDYTHDALGRRVAVTANGTTRKQLLVPALGEGLDTVHLVSNGSAHSAFIWAGAQPLARLDAGDPRYFLTDGLGSVIALSDATGDVVSRTDYDGFGNVVSSSGEPSPAHLGGSLAFHGAWREAATGLYHLRAREYDPVSGRFLSRDPAKADPFEPESFHPYVFAYSNPLVYSDPTGLFGISVPGVSVTLNIQSLVDSFKTAALQQIKNQVIEKIGQAVTEFVSRRLLGIIGLGVDERLPIVSGLTFSQLGMLFEHTVGEIVCTFFGSEEYGFGVWFEPEITPRTGDAETDGFGCGARPDGVARKKGQRYPDFLVRQKTPTNTSVKTIVTGEVKLRIGTMYRSWISPGRQRTQWDAIYRHATNKGYFPHVVFLVALFREKGKAYQERKIIEKGLNSGATVVLMVAL